MEPRHAIPFRVWRNGRFRVSDKCRGAGCGRAAAGCMYLIIDAATLLPPKKGVAHPLPSQGPIRPAALMVRGVDGLLIHLRWNAISTGVETYDWTALNGRGHARDEPEQTVFGRRRRGRRGAGLADCSDNVRRLGREVRNISGECRRCRFVPHLQDGRALTIPRFWRRSTDLLHQLPPISVRTGLTIS